jgi:3-methyladenine DNA glycosylase/8-oxoguanine DNA glycosylase
LACDDEPDPFRALIRSIVYQQLSGKAAGTIFARVLALYAPSDFPTADQILATPEEKLRSAGLSRSKTLAILDVARKKADGLIPSPMEIHAMSDDEIVERLTEIRGVGRWTVEMFLMFTLGRPDVFPATDYGVRKGFARVYRKRALPEPRKLLELSRRWSPHRSAAAWYLWRALELAD